MEKRPENELAARTEEGARETKEQVTRSEEQTVKTNSMCYLLDVIRFLKVIGK